MAFFDQKHGLTPMEKSDFWDFQKVFFFIVKKEFFFLTKLLTVISSLIFDQIKVKEKLAFFVQEHGLTPLKKCDFLDFQKFSRFFYGQKCFVFSLESQRALFLVLF